MARKIYTAQEMREMADNEERRWHDNVTAAMLRQAADALEKKYEYGVRFTYEGGADSVEHSRTFEVDSVKHFSTLEDAKRYVERSMNPGANIIRREVGEWEEVKE